jgi:hypothetical protein
MTTPLTPPHDVVGGATARLDAAQDAGDQERLRVLDELYAGLEAELEKEMAFPPPAGPQDLEQAGPSGR